MEKKAKGGNFVGGNVPYGFTHEPEKGLVVHEDEALIVRKMFKMYALGKEGASAICSRALCSSRVRVGGLRYDIDLLIGRRTRTPRPRVPLRARRGGRRRS
jgi:hypothetical protein